MTDQQETTPGWLVAVIFGALLAGLAMVWVILPWKAAVMATALAYLASEFGKIGARWHDDKEKGT